MQHTRGVEAVFRCQQRATECYSIRVVANGLGRVTSLTRGQIIASGSRRTDGELHHPGNELVPTDALTVSDTEQITGLTVDRDFEASRSVFVARVEDARESRRLRVVTRYREVQNTLGEDSRSLSAGACPLTH